jgi:hypothetical protein
MADRSHGKANAKAVYNFPQLSRNTWQMLKHPQYVVWMRRLLQDLGSDQTKPTLLFCDNQSAINVVRNPQKFHQFTKHIDVKFHFIRDLQDEDVVELRNAIGVFS